jgi:hypothetical protein
MRAVTGKKKKKNAASVNTIGRFETKILPLKKNLKGLSEINGGWVQKALERSPHNRVILDMDSSESPVQESKKVLYTTVILNAIFIILCFASTSKAIVRERCFVQAMSTALIAGKRCLDRSYNGMKTIKKGSAFVAMPRLRNLRFMCTLKKKGSCMMRLNIFWSLQLVILRLRCCSLQ